MEQRKTKQLVLAAVFLSLGIILPFFTSQIKEIGDTLLPMHVPVMFCGLVCGPFYGMAVGFVLPLLRGAIFSMPPVYPQGVWMAFELATYGFVIGFLYRCFPKKNVKAVYLSLISAQIAGRIVWGIVKAIILGMENKGFTVQAFIAGGFLDALPGIILQLVLIPAVMSALNRAGAE